MNESEAKDLILEYCLKNPKEPISSNTIQKEVPELAAIQTGVIDLWIKRIDGIDDKVARVDFGEFGNFIASNKLTDTFLKQGGFSKYEKEEAEQKHIQNERDNIAFEKSKIDLDLAKKMLKEYPKTKWMSRLGFFIGTVLAILKLVEYLGLLQSPD